MNNQWQQQPVAFFPPDLHQQLGGMSLRDPPVAGAGPPSFHNQQHFRQIGKVSETNWPADQAVAHDGVVLSGNMQPKQGVFGQLPTGVSDGASFLRMLQSHQTPPRPNGGQQMPLGPTVANSRNTPQIPFGTNKTAFDPQGQQSNWRDNSVQLGSYASMPPAPPSRSPSLTASNVARSYSLQLDQQQQHPHQQNYHGHHNQHSGAAPLHSQVGATQYQHEQNNWQHTSPGTTPQQHGQLLSAKQQWLQQQVDQDGLKDVWFDGKRGPSGPSQFPQQHPNSDRQQLQSGQQEQLHHQNNGKSQLPLTLQNQHGQPSGQHQQPIQPETNNAWSAPWSAALANGIWANSIWTPGGGNIWSSGVSEKGSEDTPQTTTTPITKPSTPPTQTPSPPPVSQQNPSQFTPPPPPPPHAVQQQQQQPSQYSQQPPGFPAQPAYQQQRPGFGPPASHPQQQSMQGSAPQHMGYSQQTGTLMFPTQAGSLNMRAMGAQQHVGAQQQAQQMYSQGPGLQQQQQAVAMQPHSPGMHPQQGPGMLHAQQASALVPPGMHAQQGPGNYQQQGADPLQQGPGMIQPGMRMQQGPGMHPPGMYPQQAPGMHQHGAVQMQGSSQPPGFGVADGYGGPRAAGAPHAQGGRMEQYKQGPEMAPPPGPPARPRDPREGPHGSGQPRQQDSGYRNSSAAPPRSQQLEPPTLGRQQSGGSKSAGSSQGGSSGVDRELQELCQWLAPTEEERATQDSAFTTIKQILLREWPNAKVHLFGSAANQLSIRDNNDLDVCLELPGDGPIDKGAVIERVDRIMREAGMTQMLALPKARVPVCKFTFPATSTHIDVSCGNMLAIVNTKLLRDYAAIDPRLRQLVYLVKFWAKRRCVNDTYRGTLSSYAYVLLCIFFLQTRRPPVLPVLQAFKPTYRKTIGGWCCDYCDDIDRLRNFGAQNREGLGELLTSFFRYWDTQHDYSNSVVSIRAGKLLSKSEKDWTRRIGTERHLVCIEDPFDTSHDLGRTIDPMTSQILRKEFHRAATILTSDPNPVQKLFEQQQPQRG